MNNNWKKILFLNRSVAIRVWMWSAISSLIFYLIKFTIMELPDPTELDMMLMAYGLGSIAAYVLIFGFDWS